MSNLAFDTYKFVKDLTKSGMPDKQAEVLADHYARLLDDRLTTKDDLATVHTKISISEQNLRTEITTLDSRLTTEVAALDAKITALEDKMMASLATLRKDMMITILSAQLVSITVICTIIGFLLTLA
ncbi:MAG: coiled-coil domain-containing protein [Candidatus Puniceispirillaceae bacterium]